MEGVMLLPQQYRDALVAMSNDAETIGIVILCIALVGLLAYLTMSGRKEQSDGGLQMGKPIDYKRVQVQFSKTEKRVMVEMATDFLEEKALFRKMSRSKKQVLYHKIGLACDIPELMNPGTTKARLKALRRYLDGKNKPVIIPGDAPPQEVKPTDLTRANREVAEASIASIFAKPKAA